MTDQIKRQPPKRQMLFCEPCGYKRIIELEEIVIVPPKDMIASAQPTVPKLAAVENKTSAIQLKLPTLDPVTGKTIPSKFQPQAKRYKCPCCGRAAKMRELLKPFADALVARDESARKQKEEEEKMRRLQDGRPPEKKVDPDFLG